MGEGGIGVQASIPSDSAFLFAETLKGRLLGNGSGVDVKLCGFVSN